MFFFRSRTYESGRRNHGCLWTIIVCVVIYIISAFVVGKKMGGMFNTPEAKLQQHSVYKLELKNTLVEQAQEDNPFASAFSGTPYASQTKVGLDNVLSNIRLAKTDSQIDGIYLYGGELACSAASAKEIHDALLDFKQSGKFIIAYSESYMAYNYYIASVADKIYFNPQGLLVWRGFVGYKTYYTRVLQKLGVEMQIVKVGSFKSAVEPFTRTSMSAADREQTRVMVSGLWEEVVNQVAQNRSLTPENLQKYADECMEYQPQEKLVEYGFVDQLIFPQEMDTILKQACGGDYKLFTTNQLATVKRPVNSSTPSLAVVYAEGEISDDGNEGIVAKKLVKTLDKIRDNSDIKAVVLRVNSPGGSAYASEQIWNAVELLKQKGKKVVVSMGDLAASGGYYISCGADYVFAQPTTLTGSIGIFGMIPNVRNLTNKIGIDVDMVETNKNSGIEIDMIYKGMNAREYALLQGYVERGYDLFTKRCAEGRKMPQDSIKAIAEGRVWLGKDALQIGLVDELGSINEAIGKAAQLAELPEGYAITYYPKAKSYMDDIFKMFDNTTDEEKLLLKLKTLVQKPQIMALMQDITVQ